MNHPPSRASADQTVAFGWTLLVFISSLTTLVCSLLLVGTKHTDNPQPLEQFSFVVGLVAVTSMRFAGTRLTRMPTLKPLYYLSLVLFGLAILGFIIFTRI